jgi:uroporphyrin-III C-methyltransferase
MKPKLTLVGAGPGDPELITLKGLKAIRNADSILYDALVSEELLKHAPAHCVMQYVGKRYGQHSMQQEEINQLRVEFAFKYGNVVRLKGGDPFIFGRAPEEIHHAETFDIDVEVIPGLSSATAVAASNKIALTQRGVSRGFRVITGTISESELNEDLITAAHSGETTVILMGMNKLQLITELFSTFGKADLPVAIIQNGTMPNQKVVTGLVKDIYAKAKEEQIKSPAVIVIGESVEWRKAFSKVTVEIETKHNEW